jgi:hypothetical protein
LARVGNSEDRLHLAGPVLIPLFHMGEQLSPAVDIRISILFRK